MKITLGIILTFFLLGCSSDDNEIVYDAGTVTYNVNGKEMKYTQLNSFIVSGGDMVLSFADNHDSSIGINLETDGRQNSIFNVGNAQEKDVTAIYSGPGLPVTGYSVNSTYINLPQLNKKGHYTISIESIKDKRISGKFEFVAYSDDNKDSVVVKNGIFKNIPSL